MSASKGPPALDFPDAPPPPYTESLTNSQPATSLDCRVNTLISTHILPHISNKSTTTLVLVPFDVTPLFAQPANESSKDATPLAYPGEKLVGFDSDEQPLLIRLSQADGGLAFWGIPAVLRELTTQLIQTVRSMGYRVVPNAESSVGGEWRPADKEPLANGQARLLVEVKEVCLRIENEMGLYETRSGMAVVVCVELGYGETGAGDIHPWLLEGSHIKDM
ncbi:MAG: hypothetical protein LQ337_004698 [Flavoplaca oasis]|nr:MAG: hypothetical protein LQ337_004698 [Flavoplaca oasis]